MQKICKFLYGRCHSECHIFSKFSTFSHTQNIQKQICKFWVFWRTDEQALLCLMSHRARLTSDHICRPSRVTCLTPNMPRLPSDIGSFIFTTSCFSRFFYFQKNAKHGSCIFTFSCFSRFFYLQKNTKLCKNYTEIQIRKSVAKSIIICHHVPSCCKHVEKSHSKQYFLITMPL